jgi:hypothetical protein
MNPLPTINELLSDPSVSYWLKNALRALLKRDALDAVHDAELLAGVMRERLENMGCPRV